MVFNPDASIGTFLFQAASENLSQGFKKMQESLQYITSSLLSNQALQASGLVGRTVYINSNHIYLGGIGEVLMAIEVVPDLDELSLSIALESGELIETLHWEKPQPGFFELLWNGTQKERVEPGYYFIEARGICSGKEKKLNTLVSANVNSVCMGQSGEGLRLNVSGIGSVSLDKVRQIVV